MAVCCRQVICILNYCNSLHSGCPKHLEKVKKVQKSTERLVVQACKWDHASSLLWTLHIQACIDYKLSTLFSDTAPVCLSGLLHFFMCILHQDNSAPFLTQELYEPLKKHILKPKHLASTLFSYAAPSVRNSLPLEMRHIQSTTTFKTVLKTLLFKAFYC